MVTVLGSETPGAYPFTAPFAVDLGLDPALLASAPRSAAAVESPHRRHSAADLIVAGGLARALADTVTDPADLGVRRIGAIVKARLVWWP